MSFKAIVISCFLLCMADIAVGQNVPSVPSAYPSARDLTVGVSAEVRATSDRNVFVYDYTISNSSLSKQPLAIWGVEYSSRTIVTITGTPSGWIQNETIGGQPLSGWAALGNARLAPGLLQSGFQSRAQGLPGIVRALAVGFIRSASLPIGDEEGAPGSSIFENSINTKTIGPVPIPSEKDVLALLGLLMDQTHEAINLGWVKNAGTANSIQAKLDAAQKALAGNQSNTAGNILNALINEVDAQSDKQLSSEAVALLKYNTEYLISKLP